MDPTPIDPAWEYDPPPPRVQFCEQEHLPSYKSVVEKDLPAVRARAYDNYLAAFPTTKFGNLEELVTHNPELAQAYIDLAHHKHRKQIKKATRDVQIRAFEMYLSKYPVTPHSTIWTVQSQNYRQADHYINKAYVTLELERRRRAYHQQLNAEARRAILIQQEKQERERVLARQKAAALSEVKSGDVREWIEGTDEEERVKMTEDERVKMARDEKLREREGLWICIGQQRRLYKHNRLIDKTNGKGREDEGTRVIGERLKAKEKAWKEMKKDQEGLVKEFVEWRNLELEEKEGILEKAWFRLRRPLWRYKGQTVEN